MASKVTALPKKKRTLSSKLFDLFKESQDFTITGPNGEAVPIVLRQLDHGQNAALQSRLQTIRAEVIAATDMAPLKAALLEELAKQPLADVISNILTFERGIAQEQADLAPDATDDQKKEHSELVQAEKERVEKWEAARKTELEALDADEVREVMADRTANLVTQTKTLQEFLDLAISYMAFDAETNEPLVCYEREDEDGNLNPDWIGNLSPQVREQLVVCRSKFLSQKDEKSIRAVAESGDFLQSGALPNESADSLGATTASPSISPQPSSPSTPSEAGSIT